MTTELDQLDPNEAREARLTAYALGELDEADRARVETELASDEAGRAFVEQVRSAADLLADELRREPEPPPLKDLRTVVEQRLEERLRLRRSPLRKRPLIWIPMSVILTAIVVMVIAFVALYLIMSM